MDRRSFFKGVLGLTAFPQVARAAIRKYRVSVLGVAAAVNAADAIRWTAPFWLDTRRFELSALLLPMASWGPDRKLVGAYGEVPGQFVRPWGDLSWMGDDLRDVDCAIVLMELLSEAQEAAAVKVIEETRRLASRSLTIALDPWCVADGKLVPDPDPRVMKARISACLASEAVQSVLGNDAAEARHWLAAFREGRQEFEWDRWESSNRRVRSSEIDQLCAPVIRTLAAASRRHLLPSGFRGSA